MTLRYNPSPAELVDFAWPRMHEPRWMVPREGALLWGSDEFWTFGEGRVLFGADGAIRQPLREDGALFRNFAALGDTEDAFAGFAAAYGDLGGAMTAPEWINDEEVMVHGLFEHTLGAWKAERELMALAVRLWDALRQGRAAQVIGPDVATTPTLAAGGDVGVQVRFPDTRGLTTVGRRLEWGYAGTAPAGSSAEAIVQVALAGLVFSQSNARMVVSPVAPPRAGSAGLRLTYAPYTLQDAMWLQLALAIDGNRRYETCRSCGEQWDATSARSDRETCSDRCRKRLSRSKAAVKEGSTP